MDGSVGGIGVAPGATLTGEGQAVGPLTVGGTLRPGAGLGTDFDAAGDVTLAAGSTLAVDVQYDAGTSAQSTLVVGGSTTLEGGTVDVTVAPGDYSAIQTFDVVTSASIIENAPVVVAPLYAFVDVNAQPNGGATALQVTVEENGANAVIYAETRNQLEVATALDQLIATDTLDDDVQRSLVSVTVDDLPRVLDEMSAISLSMMFTQRLEHGRRFSRAVSRRFTAARYEDSPPKPRRRAPMPVRRTTPAPTPAPTSADEKPRDRLHGPNRVEAPSSSPPPSPAPPEPEPIPPPPESAAPPPVDAGPATRVTPAGGSESGLALWGDAFGVFGRVDGGAESEDVKTRVYGFTVGADYRLPEGRLLPEGHGLRFGGAVDYGRAVPQGERGRTRTEANLVLVGGHASWTRGPLYAGLVGRYGYMDAESRRRVVFGDIDDTAVGEFDGHEGGVFTELGARIDVGRGVLVQPRVGFEWTRLSQSGFSESGAPGLDLDVGSASIDSLRPFVVANVAAQMTLRDRFGIEPELRLGWGMELGDLDRLIEASLDGAAFSSMGARTARHEALLGAGYTMRLTRGVALALDYDARLGEKHASHAIAASLHMQW